jgi:hypothetical protein
MAKPSNLIARAVVARARTIEHHIDRMEKLYLAREILRSDINRIYAGAFLTYFTFLERSIEQLFMGLLMNRLTMSQRDVRSLIDVRSEVVVRRVVAGERRYVDWIPFDERLRRRAKAFLAGGRPFSTVSLADRKVLERAALIRNALAHDSTFAIRQFSLAFVDGLGLPPEQHSPPGYLRGQQRVGQTRMIFVFAECSGMMTRLCT